MFIYMPNQYSCDRVVWHGGQSTQLHYEQKGVDDCGKQTWIEKEIRTLGNGMPEGMSELHSELVNFYNFCQ